MTTCREMRVPTFSVLATAPLGRMQLHFDLSISNLMPAGMWGCRYVAEAFPSVRAGVVLLENGLQSVGKGVGGNDP